MVVVVQVADLYSTAQPDLIRTDKASRCRCHPYLSLSLPTTTALVTVAFFRSIYQRQHRCDGSHSPISYVAQVHKLLIRRRGAASRQPWPTSRSCCHSSGWCTTTAKFMILHSLQALHQRHKLAINAVFCLQLSSINTSAHIRTMSFSKTR